MAAVGPAEGAVLDLAAAGPEGLERLRAAPGWLHTPLVALVKGCSPGSKPPCPAECCFSWKAPVLHWGDFHRALQAVLADSSLQLRPAV